MNITVKRLRKRLSRAEKRANGKLLWAVLGTEGLLQACRETERRADAGEPMPYPFGPQ